MTESWLARDTVRLALWREGAPENQRPSQPSAQLALFVDEIERVLVMEPFVGSRDCPVAEAAAMVVGRRSRTLI